MADLTQAANLRHIGEIKLEKFSVDTSTAQTVFRGQPMIIDQNVDTIFLTPFVTALVVDPSDVFVGIAMENLTTLSGDVESVKDSGITVAVWPSIVGFVSTVFTHADLGATMYMEDSATLSSTAADNPQIGTLYKVEDGYHFVRLDSPVVATGA